MAKRTATVAGFQPRGGLRSTAKHAKVHNDTIPGFLCLLPAEIRNAIYDYALSDLRNAPSKPYAPFKSDFTTYRALQLTSKQFDVEVKYIFNQKYASNLTIFIDNVPALYDLLAASNTNPVLANLRFQLCTSCEFGGTAGQSNRPKIRGIACLIAQQHGMARRAQLGFTGYDVRNVWTSPSLLHYNGIAHPRRTDGPEHKVLDYERFGGGLELKTYVRNDWRTSTATQYKGMFWVVSGRVGDLVMDSDANIKRMRG